MLPSYKPGGTAIYHMHISGETWSMNDNSIQNSLSVNFIKRISSINEQSSSTGVPAILRDGLPKGVDGNFCTRRDPVGDLVRCKIVARAGQCNAFTDINSPVGKTLIASAYT